MAIESSQLKKEADRLMKIEGNTKGSEILTLAQSTSRQNTAKVE